MMEIRTVNTILYCNKWNETVDFYKTHLRLPVTTSLEWFVELKLNETSRLSIANTARTSIGSSGGNGITITMEIDDIKTTHSYLEDAGLNPTAIIDHPWVSKVVYIYDPEGHRLEFWSQDRKVF